MLIKKEVEAQSDFISELELSVQSDRTGASLTFLVERILNLNRELDHQEEYELLVALQSFFDGLGDLVIKLRAINTESKGGDLDGRF